MERIYVPSKRTSRSFRLWAKDQTSLDSVKFYQEEVTVMTFESNREFDAKGLARRNEAVRILEKCVED